MATKKKTVKKAIITIIVLIVIAALITVQAMVGKQYNQAFKQRYSSEANRGLMEFTDFDNLRRQGIEFSSNRNQVLQGYFYSATDNKNYKGLIVFSHGFGGGGHKSYLPQINYFAQNGYMCFAYDGTGNDESEGTTVMGLPQGSVDLKYALRAVRQSYPAEGLDIMLYGHSWGGYSVCSVLKKETDIKAAVSLSGFNKSQDMLLDQATQMFGNGAVMLTPFLKMCDFYKFGSKSFYSSMSGLKKTHTNVLLLHGDDDTIVSPKKSIDLYQKKLSDKNNITTKKLAGKGHEVMLSQKAIDYNKQKNAEFQKAKDENGGELSDEFIEDWVSKFDKKQSNELDETIMKEILDFYNNSLSK